MAMQVCNGALCECSFGVAPSALIVLPKNRVMAPQPAATIMDNIPMVNILPFAMCQSMANPQVAAATAAAFGVLTPMPCVPVVHAPWAPGSPTVMIGNTPVLNNNSKATCMWGGLISITNPGQTATQVP